MRDARAIIEDYTAMSARLKGAAVSWDGTALCELVDNLYFVDMHVTKLRRNFDGYRGRQLPGFESGGRQQFRIMEVSEALVASCDGAVDSQSIVSFVRAVQESQALDLDELWLLPDMCSMAMLAALVATASVLMDAPREPSTQPASPKLKAILMSLRFVENATWHAIVDKTCVSERILALDPSGHYSRMDVSTRNEYRFVVSRLARRHLRSESEVAMSALEHARVGGRSPAHNHVGYYLVGDGLGTLSASLTSKAQGVRADATSANAYIAYHAFAALFAAGTFCAFLCWRGVSLGLSTVMGALFGLALQQPVSRLLDVLLVRSRRSLMPRMDYQKGIPPSAATFVVVPCLLESVSAIDQLVKQLREQHLRNRSPNLHFALLSDFVDAKTQHAAQDDELLAHAVDAIARLNSDHCVEGNEAIFHLFHRARVWNESERAWIGYERKRGKLAAFNRLLLHGDVSAFSRIELPLRRQKFRYVITLDADTCMPAGVACKLVGVIDHPLNRPVFGRDGNRVSQGYGIIQPAISTMMPAGGATRYARFWGGRAGLDRYVQGGVDPYHELFAEGSFMGKGIYDVEAFERATGGRFPDSRVLSHDLIEGCFARCTVVSDIHLMEAYAPSYTVDTDRRLRWMRGDWQLAAWAGRYIPSRSGKVRSDLSALSRYKIVENVLRGLAEPAAFCLVIVALLESALQVAAVSILVSCMVAGAVTETAGVLLRRVKESGKAVAHPQFLSTLLRPALMDFFRVACLPRAALEQSYTALQCLWRLFVTRRHLLAWRTFSQASRKHFKPAAWVYAVLLALTTGIACILVSPSSLPVALPLIFIWLVAPIADAWLSGPTASGTPPLNLEDERFLREVARKTWGYFDEHMNASTNWLPPDHFRELPEATVAPRTSPTNIGLGLLAVVAAHDLEFITLEDAVGRLGACLKTVHTLEKRQGHLYNWYDTHTLQPLEPRYVSTVDSGNLVGHVMVARQFLHEAAKEAWSVSQLVRGFPDAVKHLIQICDALVGADFGFLYDEERALLHLGIAGASEHCDSGHYDMLASEARLAVYVAIARGQIPAEAWYSLGRLHTQGSGGAVLLSWSGSMFEYLMPALVMPDIPGSLLANTIRGAIARQMSEAGPGGPWGVSECGYAEHEPTGDYSYQAFGSPSLGLQPGLERRLVVAPYATAMACVVAPVEAAANFRVLAELGLLGKYGFLEALDFGERGGARQPEAVAEYMAHHQGMSLLGLAHALTLGRMRARFQADIELAASQPLLDERMPDRCEVIARG
jgi:cyclic beta-1,2-glucan synthetase